MGNVKTTFSVNVKYGKTPYKLGQTVELSQEEYDEFLQRGLVSDKYEEVVEPIIDIEGLSAEEIDKRFKADQIKAYLKAHEIDLSGTTKKDELIALAIGE